MPPRARLRTSRLCLVQLGLRRQAGRRRRLHRGRARRLPRLALRRHEARVRADEPGLCRALRLSADRASLLHRVRPVGTPRHGLFRLHAENLARRSDRGVRRRQDGARLHLYRRHRRRHRRRARSSPRARPEPRPQHRRQPPRRPHGNDRDAGDGARPQGGKDHAPDAARRRHRNLCRRVKTRRADRLPTQGDAGGGPDPLRRMVSGFLPGGVTKGIVTPEWDAYLLPSLEGRGRGWVGPMSSPTAASIASATPWGLARTSLFQNRSTVQPKSVKKAVRALS
ncbi:hypothetical protein SPHINGO361_90068 [Sphingomonas sp. EC-HK361]|nr:hypothetical protein SPHINGO361_90068 [Sphingomonas sp. EC-HK361]